MPRVRLRPDTLDEENRRFAQQRLTRPLFLNSVPKSGSHLLKNIMRMFVPLEDHFNAQFIQWGNLQRFHGAFDPEKRYLSWGHLLFSDASAVATARVKKIVLVRDPYTWVLARARFFISDQFGDERVLVKDAGLSPEALLNLMIFGIHQKAMPLRELYTMNAVAWLGPDTTLIRYEDIIAALQEMEGAEAEAFFARLFEAGGVSEVPGDWRERVRIGADRRQSGTARENLTEGAIQLPRELMAQQRAMVDFAAPGLRALLGYT